MKTPERPEDPQAVELAFLEGVERRCPERAEVLRPLADLYTRAGRIADGLRLDLRLVRLVPGDPLAWYNLGCSYCLDGQVEHALDALARAIRLGYRDKFWLRQDEDLAALRGDPRLETVIALITDK